MFDHSEIESAYALNLTTREQREYLQHLQAVPKYTDIRKHSTAEPA